VSKRSASFIYLLKAKIGVFVPFSAAYARRLMPVNRALKAARVPCALFAALEASYGWTGQQSGSGFINLAPSILHYNWF
jgi:hypothetical protein